MFAKIVLFWFVLFALAFTNGAVREVALVPWLGRAVALPLSGLTGSALLAAAIVAFVRRTRPTPVRAGVIGLVWVAMTIAAEVAMVAASGQPAATVAYAFTPAAIRDGDLFALLVAVVLLAPVAAAAVRPRAG